MRTRWTALLIGVLLASPASAASDRTDLVRGLAGRVGPVVGAALACRNVARSRLQAVVDRFYDVIREASDQEADRRDLAQVFDSSINDGTNALKSGETDCATADRRLGDLERSGNLQDALNNPASVSLVNAVGPSSAAAAAAAATAPVAIAPAAFAPATLAAAPVAVAASAPVAQAPAADVHGVTASEIRFGIVIPFSGTRKEAGRELKLGIDVAFNRQNDAGGVNGRTLKLIAADDAYDPSRTLAAMKKLYEEDQVFGYIGNVGTATTAAAIPFALEHRALFFGAFTGANVVRHDPPDRYVFNYRPSYSEEADAIVRYLVKKRRIPPRQIAVFVQQDSYGEAGFAGVAKAFRGLGLNDGTILKLTYPRDTMEVDAAVSELRRQKIPMKAVIIVSTDRAAAKFIEKTRDAVPGLLYGNVSAVGATSLAGELMMLGPRFTNGVIVTQIVPAIEGHSNLVLEYKNAIAKYAPGEQPNDTSLEGYVSASVLIEALKRAGRQIDTEKLVDNLEAMNNFDLGLGTSLSFGRGEHQASHKIWGTALDETGSFRPIELE